MPCSECMKKAIFGCKVGGVHVTEYCLDCAMGRVIEGGNIESLYPMSSGTIDGMDPMDWLEAMTMA